MNTQDIHSIRQDIRDQFPYVNFPEPTIEPVFYGKKEKLLCPRNSAVVNYKNGEVLSICSHKYVLIHHEDILHQALLETKELAKELGTPQIDVEMINRGAGMVYKIHWPEKVKEVAKGDAVSPLFRGVNSYDSTRKVRSEYGAMRLVCTNGMIGGVVDSSISHRHIGDVSAEWVREHISAGVKTFSETIDFLEDVALHSFDAEKYEMLWTKIPFSPRERQKIEALPLLGFDGDTLQNHMLTLPDGSLTLAGRVSAWLVQAALTQYNSHEMKSSDRSIELASKIGQVMLEMV